MAAGIVSRELGDPPPGAAQTAGQRLYRQYGVAGVRGQAEAGFPAVLDRGLPVLEAGLALGQSPDEAGAAALLALLTQGEDTNLLSRGGPEVCRAVLADLERLLRETPYPDRETLLRLDREFIAQNLSPGGSADQLALCWLLHFLGETPV